MPDPVNIRGIQPLAWGTELITGFVTNATTRDASTEEFMVRDEEGRVVTHITGFGRKTEFSLEVIPKQSAPSLPSPGAVLTVGTEKVVVLNISKKRAQGDVEKWSMKGVQFPDIALTT